MNKKDNFSDTQTENMLYKTRKKTFSRTHKKELLQEGLVFLESKTAAGQIRILGRTASGQVCPSLVSYWTGPGFLDSHWTGPGKVPDSWTTTGQVWQVQNSNFC